MRACFLLISAAFLALAGCQRNEPAQNNAGQGPQLEAPAPEAEPVRAFATDNDAANTASGPITVSITTRMPDASAADSGAVPHDVLTVTGANHLVLEAESFNSVTPATQIEHQTLRALMSLPVETAQVVVYKVTSETKPDNGQGICGANAPAYVIVWEPDTPGDASLKLMGVANAAPGAAGAHACPMLQYRRQ